MDENEKCGARCGECVCGLDKHPADVFHECEDKTRCNGSWNGSVETNDFDVARFPGTEQTNEMAQLLVALLDRTPLYEEVDDGS